MVTGDLWPFNGVTHQCWIDLDLHCQHWLSGDHHSDYRPWKCFPDHSRDAGHR